MRLHGALLFVKDLPRMAAFYQSLGLQPIPETRTDTWLELDAGGVRVALHAIPPLIADRIEISSPPTLREENPVKLIFAVDDLPAECRRLEALGVRLIQRPWGATDGIDPEGNIFQLRAPPSY